MVRPTRLEKSPVAAIFGNLASMVLPEGSLLEGSGNADSRRNHRSSGAGGLRRGSRCDFACVPADPHYWASASYRPLRAVWALAPGHSGVWTDSTKKPLQALNPIKRIDPKGISR